MSSGSPSGQPAGLYRRSLRLYSNTLQSIACGYLIASLALLNLRVVWADRVGGRLARRLLAAAHFGSGAWLRWAVGSDAQPGHVRRRTDLGRFRDGTHYTWILSSMAFGGTVLMGVFSGHLLRSGLAPWKKVAWLLVIGAACMGVGWAWSRARAGHGDARSSSTSGTSSMVFWAGGLMLSAAGSLLPGGRRVEVPPLVVRLYRDRFQRDPGLYVRRVVQLAIARHRQPTGWRNSDQPDGYAVRAASPHRPRPRRLRAPFLVLWVLLWYLYRNKTFIRI